MAVFEKIWGSYNEPRFKEVKDGYKLEFGKKGSEEFTVYLRCPKKNIMLQSVCRSIRNINVWLYHWIDGSNFERIYVIDWIVGCLIILFQLEKLYSVKWDIRWSWVVKICREAAEAYFNNTAFIWKELRKSNKLSSGITGNNAKIKNGSI
jgi:hypothetical protein